MENDNQIIIQLLREQNATLHQLLEFHQKKEKREFRNTIIHYIIMAIPYIIIIILGYYLYEGIMGYLDAINDNIKSVQDGYMTIQTSMQSAIDKLTSIPAQIVSAVKSIDLNPFQ